MLGGLGVLGSKSQKPTPDKPAATTLGTPRSADAEQAFQEKAFTDFEGILKFNAAGSIMGQAGLEAWQAAKAATGATTLDKINDAWVEEMRKQTMQHPDESSTSLSGRCDPEPSMHIIDIDDQTKHCDYEKITFRRNYWFALQGDYRAQQYVAFCFGKGHYKYCSRIAQPSELMSCAWSLVALSSGSPLVEPGDVDLYRSVCEEYNAYERDAFRAQAFALFSQIYHKPLPGVLFGK